MSDASFQGTTRVVKDVLQKISENAPKEFGRAQKFETNIEAREARKRTPRDTGDLQDTVRAVGPFYEGNRIRTAVTAGDEVVHYAWIVHEDLLAHHPYGQAKYIESTLMESRPYMAERIGRRIDLNRIRAAQRAEDE